MHAGTDPDRGGNLDLLRMVSGLVVVYGNGMILTGAPPSGLWGAPLSRFGLDMLFAISGFTLAGSWLRQPRLLAFAQARLRRLLPGLAVCVLVTVAVIGALATHLTLKQYAFNIMTIRYLGNMAFGQQLWLPLVFQGQQWAGTVNPMLWTLPAGLLFCLVLPWRKWVGLASIACVVAVLSWPLVKGAHFYHPRHVEVLIEFPFFLVGALLRRAEHRWPGLWRADLAMLLFAANWISATWLGEANLLLEWVSLPYMLACFGRMSMPVLGRVGRLGHPGYGLYLYAFPIQQLIVARWPDCPYPILLCAGVALLAGYASWHLVERPALAWNWRRSALLRRLSPSYSAP